ncbi:tetratricopeptide repeat protein [Actinocrispum wychmicini]|uniref:Tetratricopeptide repeat protein n=2 Tax=Actinocrispum wychmicini TaxID=1213861 RepID=A0A4V2S873_9PSEU|nr:tetratricopeptide repeat protein [Actinocrispum wychmicini]
MAELDDDERSVSATFDLSCQELPPDQRRMFALLTVHRGPDIDVSGAAALAGTGVRQAERLLDRLCKARLIDHAGPGRYRLLDQVRVFAAEHAVLPLADREVAAGRLLDHVLGMAEAADVLLSPHRYRPDFGLPPATSGFAGLAEAKAWLAVELPNLVALCRTALVYGVYNRCWQLAYTLGGYFYLARLWDPWIETHTMAIAAARNLGDQRAEAMTLNNMGVAYVDRGERDQAAACYQRALGLFRVVGDEHGLSNCLVNLAWVRHYQGNHAVALRDMWRAVEFYRHAASAGNAAITLRGIALMQVDMGAVTYAIRHAADSLAAFRRLGMTLDAVLALNILGHAYFKVGNHTRAAACYREAIALSEQNGSRSEAARAELGLSRIATAAGRADEAAGHLARAERLHPAAGDH